MIIEWLEPVIEKRCETINDFIINSENNQLYNELMKIIKCNHGFNEDDVLDIENIFLLAIRNGVEYSYREGLKDGISIYRK